MQEISTLLTSLRAAYGDVYAHALPQGRENVKKYAILRPSNGLSVGRANALSMSMEIQMYGSDYQDLAELHDALFPVFHFFGPEMRIDEEYLPETAQLVRVYSFSMFVSLLKAAPAPAL